MPSIVAIFDLDETLTEGHVWTGLSSYCRTFKVNRFRTYLFFVTHGILWLLFKLWLLPRNTFYSLWIRDMAIMLKGIPRPKSKEVFYWITSRELTPKQKPEIIKELEWHQRQNHLVILISSTFNELLRHIGKTLDVTHTIGTVLEVKENRYTGKTLGQACFGQEKALLLQHYIKHQMGVEVDLSKSYGYGNDLQDIAMLELLGNPAVVHPDKKLSKIAKQRNWRIIPKVKK